MAKKIIDKLALIHVHNRRFLATRSHGKALFYLPGGKREAGESDQQALIREIKEELAADLDSSTIEYAGVFSAQADGKPEGVVVQLTCYHGELKQQARADSEIAEIAWLSRDDRERCSVAALLVMDWLVKQDLID